MKRQPLPPALRDRDGTVREEPDQDSTCPTCHALVAWYRTLNGKVVPLEPVPDPEGNVLLVKVHDQWKAKILKGSDARPGGSTFHYRHDCSRAHSRPQDPPPRRDPQDPVTTREASTSRGHRCTVCQRTLDETLVALGGHDATTHPACYDPEG